MKSVKFPILFTTAYLVFFSVIPWFGASLEMMLTLFVCSPFLLVWMVFRILKDGQPSVKKFSEGSFYEDWNYKAIPEN